MIELGVNIAVMEAGRVLLTLRDKSGLSRQEFYRRYMIEPAPLFEQCEVSPQGHE